jgi:hypothetical protein
MKEFFLDIIQEEKPIDVTTKYYRKVSKLHLISCSNGSPIDMA